MISRQLIEKVYADMNARSQSLRMAELCRLLTERLKLGLNYNDLWNHGLTTEDLRYILGPENVCGPGCINKAFRVLKDNETRQFGDYRTKRLVIEAWHRFNYDN